MNKAIIWYEDNIIGRRTYIVAFIAALLNVLMVFGVIKLTPEQFIAVDGLIMAIGLGTLRSAVNK